MRSKKGVSQILVYVLLVGLAVGLGTFVTIWYRGIAETQLETLVVPFATGAECQQVNVNVNFTFNDPVDGCKLRFFNSGVLKWQRIEIVTVPDLYPEESPFVLEAEVLPKSWYELILPSGTSGRLKLEVFPVIETQGKLVKCQKNRVFDSQTAFNCP